MGTWHTAGCELQDSPVSLGWARSPLGIRFPWPSLCAPRGWAVSSVRTRQGLGWCRALWLPQNKMKSRTFLADLIRLKSQSEHQLVFFPVAMWFLTHSRD